MLQQLESWPFVGDVEDRSNASKQLHDANILRENCRVVAVFIQLGFAGTHGVECATCFDVVREYKLMQRRPSSISRHIDEVRAAI